MNDLVPRKPSRLSRSRRVDRGYNLVLASGVSGVVFAVTIVLAIAGVIGSGVPLLALLATAVFGYGAYRTINR
jgi:hypothetical protein